MQSAPLSRPWRQASTCWAGPVDCQRAPPLFEALLWGGVASPWVALLALIGVTVLRRSALWLLVVAIIASIALGVLSVIVAVWIDISLAFGADGVPSSGMEATLFYGVWVGVLSPLSLLIGAVTLLVSGRKREGA